ncbi:hypothetical protein PAEPH01_2201 [Pancytospora epiphaga]|nr:hypothetical protein PAEPH01_2201 [Pancytospora epiphaga]
MHGYMTIESSAEGPHRGLMIAIRKDIAAAAQFIEQSHNIMVVSIRNRRAEMIICNVYRPIDINR